MAAPLRFQLVTLQKIRPLLGIRQISTSKQNSETATVSGTAKECKTNSLPVQKNWVSYGFDRVDEANDRRSLHLTFFGSITMCLVLGSFLLWYAPDINLKDWSQREAFIELRRREEAGLLPVSPDLIDPSHITLPSDEELGDTQIII